MKSKVISMLFIGLTALTLSGTVVGQELDRTSLPIKEPARKKYTELDVRNATPPPRFEVKAPKGAPNVVVVLIDDMGFGVTESFGGPISTPTLDGLAKNGVKTIVFIPQHFAHQLEWLCLLVTIIIVTMQVLLWKPLRCFREIMRYVHNL